MSNFRVLGLKMGLLMKMGPPTGGRGSRLGPKCVPVHSGDKVHYNHLKSEVFMEKPEILKKQVLLTGMGPPGGPKCWGFPM